MPNFPFCGAILTGSFLTRVTLVQTSSVNLQHIGRPEDQIETLVTSQSSSLVNQNDIVSDSAMTGAPDRDGVKQDGQTGVGDAGDTRHDGLGHVFALEGSWEVAGAVDWG